MLGRIVGSWEVTKVGMNNRVRAQHVSRRNIMSTQSMGNQWDTESKSCRVLYRALISRDNCWTIGLLDILGHGDFQPLRVNNRGKEANE